MELASTASVGVKRTAQIKDIQEIAISIAANNLTPTMLSEEFLKFSGIVPSDWALSKQPVLNPNFAQLVFQNGVSIAAQPGTINFLEAVGEKQIKALVAPELARKYVQKLPNAEYQTLNVSPKILIPLPGSQDAAREYITKNLLASGSWQEIGQSPVQAGINLLYNLQRCQLTVSINEARLQSPDKASISALLFAGTFNYNLAKVSSQERLNHLERLLESWKMDWKTFRDIVDQKFLHQQQQEEESLPTSVFSL